MLLAENFAIAMCQELGLPFFPGFSDNARQILFRLPLAGEYSRTKNVVERSVYRHGTSERELDNIIIDPFARFSSSTIAEQPQPQKEMIFSLPPLPLDLRQWQA